MKKILGLGNALVDIITELEDENLLTKLNLPKGSMTLVDNELSQAILKDTQHFKQTKASGGSAANTIHGLAKLNVPVGFIGKIGNDELGHFFETDMTNNHITTHLLTSNTNSGKAVALITKDAERTFATYLGASVELSSNDIKKEVFSNYDMLYVEGYLVQNHELLEKALQTAKSCGMEVVLDLASYNVVEDNLSFIQEMVKKYADIVFANEEEAAAFTGIKDPENALTEIAKSSQLSVVKIGKKGSLISNKGKKHQVGAQKVNSIDTTGAGDLYAAGFLYGYINNLPMEKCGEIGTTLAQEVIQTIGAKISDNNWENIRKKIKN